MDSVVLNNHMPGGEPKRHKITGGRRARTWCGRYDLHDMPAAQPGREYEDCAFCAREAAKAARRR